MHCDGGCRYPQGSEPRSRKCRSDSNLKATGIGFNGYGLENYAVLCLMDAQIKSGVSNIQELEILESDLRPGNMIDALLQVS